MPENLQKTKKQKTAKKKAGGKKLSAKRENTRSALLWFTGACLAECYLIIARHYYIDGNIYQYIAWADALVYIAVGALAAAGVGLVLRILLRKRRGAGRTAGMILLAGGLFLAVASAVMRWIFPTGTTVLCIVVPVAAVLGLFWSLYDRTCFYSVTILSLSILTLWICRRGMNSSFWKTKIIIGTVIYLVVIGIVVLLTRRVDTHDGKLGNVSVLPSDADCLPIYVACGTSVASVALALFSTAIAYYAIWVLGILVFAMAVYYTVRLL